VEVQVVGKIQVYLQNQVVLVILHPLVLLKEMLEVNQDPQVLVLHLVQVAVELEAQVQMLMVLQTLLDQVVMELQILLQDHL
tara:strand:- start:31 stop:276 length:246 start_codon:yes stop_codon:yes gene_type:complete